jgi:hypothetical protein
LAPIDAVLVERFRAGRMVRQELVADVVKVANDRHVEAHLQQAFLDVRYRSGGLITIDGDANQL